MVGAATRSGRRSRGRVLDTSTAPDVGLVIAAAMAPGTFAPSLSQRSVLDQGLVSGLATGLHYLLAAGAQDAVEATARFLTEGAGPPAVSPARKRAVTIAVDCAAVPLGLAVLRALPPRADDPLRGAVRQAAWRSGAPGLGGVALGAARIGAQALDDRLKLGGHLASVPMAVPVGLGVAYVLDRLRVGEPAEHTDGEAPPPVMQSLAVATGIVGCLAGVAYGEHPLTDPPAPRLAAAAPRPPPAPRRLAALLPGPPELWRLAGHAGFLAGLGVGASSVWHRAMYGIEAGTSADVPVLSPDEADRWVPATVSGGPGSQVSWAGLGREGRRHALASVRPQPVRIRPDGVPDLSIETVMGEPARSAPVQVYIGLDSAPGPRERVDLALAELERTGAFDRSLL